MSSLRQIRRRIKSVENTKKTTRAMEMVSAAKQRRFEEFLNKARPSAEFIETLLANLLADLPDFCHPLLEDRKGARKICLIVVASDTGLCGVYNSNLLHEANRFAGQRTNGETEIVCVGKMAANYFRRQGKEIGTVFSEIRLSNLGAKISEIISFATESYLEGRFAEVWIASTKLLTRSTFEPLIEKVLNLKRPGKTGDRTGYLLEPDAGKILDVLLPQYVGSKIRIKLLESFFAEQISRMLAMKQATDNASEMISTLTLRRNKIRQASITNELIEVVSGARASGH
ncbi:MAG TPA: ATP synthase F1 subunit gamma [Candidatus Omnitrophota bacterium]|nr:ATP synthase F1 subunit gamma [Candidatus Omnitrophota bacterium]